MNFVGFKKEYDKVFVESKYFLSDDSNVILSESEKNAIEQYFRRSELIFSKTLALFDGETYIAPYMIFSDGRWVWPSYYSYFIKKENMICKSFFDYMKSREFLVLPLSKERKKELVFLLEKEMLGIG